MSTIEERVEALERRVNRIDATVSAMVQMIATEVVGLRSAMDEGFAAVGIHMGELEASVASHSRQVNQVLTVWQENGPQRRRQDQLVQRLAEHFDIDLSEES